MDMTFDRERKLLLQKKAELVSGLASIDRALTALGGGQKKGAAATTTPNGPAVRAGRKPMSDKDRKAARERMLAYWAAKRAEAVKPARTRKR